MCGRTCMTLEPKEICQACKYEPKSPKKSSDTKLLPDYIKEFNCGKAYQPSYNVTPQEICPVLVSAKHFDPEKPSHEVSVVPMLWGMVPVWHKGDFRKHGLTTNNCRLEHLPSSKLYQPPFRKGQRCVLIVEGFYEWQTTSNQPSSSRPAYYIYMPQKSDIKIEDKKTWQPDEVVLLKVAGIFDVWSDPDGNLLYSFTVITFESDKKLGWLHHRTPAILESEEQVAKWLDFENFPPEIALKVIKQPKLIVWHRVSNVVNNSKHKSDECNKPLVELKSGQKKVPKSKMMQNWIVSKRRLSNEEGESSTMKIEKLSDEGSGPTSPKKIKTEEKN